MKSTSIFCWLLLTSFLVTLAQGNKKALDPSVFDSWQVLAHPLLSDDGKYACYEQNAQWGDGVLHLKHLDQTTEKAFARGYQAAFHPRFPFVVFKIKAPFDSIRKAKLAGKKDAQLPLDSLGVWNYFQNEFRSFPRVRNYQISQSKTGDCWPWVAFQQASEDTLSKRRDDKGETDTPSSPEALILFNPIHSMLDTVPDVVAYHMPRSGFLLSVIQAWGDSIDSCRVQVYDFDRQTLSPVYEGQGEAKKLTMDSRGKQLAFLASTDTGAVKQYALYTWELNQNLKPASLLVQVGDNRLPPGTTLNPNERLGFSETGRRLYFHTYPIPDEPVKDSLPENEIPRLDLWSWQDPRLQAQQLLTQKAEQRRGYLEVIDLNHQMFIRLETDQIREVDSLLKGDADVAIGYGEAPYYKLRSWDYPWYRDVYAVAVDKAQQRLLLEKQRHYARLSPSGQFLCWYNEADSSWNTLSLDSETSVCLTAELSVNFYNERHNTPSSPAPYAVVGWTEGEEFVIIQDRYDLWRFDPRGRKKPKNLTRGLGRKQMVRFSYLDMDPDDPYLEQDYLLLKGFDENSKDEAFYRLSMDSGNKLEKLLGSAHRYGKPIRARRANRLLWTRESFAESPQLFASTDAFKDIRQISRSNPQQAQYLWGSVELVKWTAYDGKKLEGLLYKPENFDPQQRYPMLVYFYERMSDRMHAYSRPMPSRSIIYPSYYVSNGYLVFIPNIEYETGQPGPDAYNAVVSGTEYLVAQYPWIDSSRMAIQGQSWGGYQVAYIVTRTKQYAAAMAGAPVSNMTSAYGGIRWSTGLSRMFQYERSQSRLGTTLWEDPERYLENSPLFAVPNIETPLLMMHNDQDGAVPWYQGIELFVALRRLQKPSWLLVYNGEGHNLRRWANRKDLSIRMEQFFDHYLKGAPAPRWMQSGIPALMKGKTLGYEIDPATE